MTQIAIITDDVRTVDANVTDGHVLLDPGALEAAVGWELKPQGLCRDDVCVPVRDRDALFVGEQLDLEGVAAALGRPVVVDADAGIAAIALDASARKQALSLEAPPFTLDDLDGNPHSLSEWHGRKKLLFASPRGEAVVTTCPGGRYCTTSSPLRASRSSASASTTRSTTFGPGLRTSRSPCSSIHSTY